jgi:hypothetical protein
MGVLIRIEPQQTGEYSWTFIDPSKSLITVSLSQQETEDDRRANDADSQNQAHQRDGDRATKIERPAQAISRRHEERRVRRISVQLTEAPVFGDKGPSQWPP